MIIERRQIETKTSLGGLESSARMKDTEIEERERKDERMLKIFYPANEEIGKVFICSTRRKTLGSV